MKKLLTTLALILALAAPAGAADIKPVPVDFTQTLKTLKGESFKDQNGKPIDLVLLDVVQSALLNDQTGARDQKDKRYALSRRLEINRLSYVVKPEEITMIHDCLALTQSTGVMGAAMDLIDPTFKAGE